MAFGDAEQVELLPGMEEAVAQVFRPAPRGKLMAEEAHPKDPLASGRGVAAPGGNR